MSPKEKIKQKIEKLSEVHLKELEAYLNQLIRDRKRKSKLTQRNLGGRFDKLNVRKAANE